MRTQRGLSLIELMIALLLGVILTLGVAQIYISSSTTHRLTDAQARLQENVRFAGDLMQHEMRMAGFRGCFPERFISNLDETDSAYDPSIHDPSAVMGWEANSTGVGDTLDLDATDGNWAGGNGPGDAVPGGIDNDARQGSDVLLVQGAELTDIDVDAVQNPGQPLNTVGPTGELQQGDIAFLVSDDCSIAELFQRTNQPGQGQGNINIGTGGNVAPGNANGGIIGSHDNNSSLYRFSSTAFYVADGADGEPALFMESMAGSAAGQRIEMIDGVETMQVLYGIGDRRGADNYVTAQGVNDWDDVVSVRIALLMKSDERVRGRGEDDNEIRRFNMLGTEVVSPEDRRVRLLSTSTIGVRNRLE